MRHYAILARVTLAFAALASATACQAEPRTISPKDAAAPLRLERIIPMPHVKGRIDHLAMDLAHHLLFVAEYGNGSVDAVDLVSGRVVGRIGGQ